MANQEDDSGSKLKRFNGSPSEDYNLWRVRSEATLRGKQFWIPLERGTADESIHEKVTSILVCALDDSALRVCRSQIGKPMDMLKTLDSWLASKRASARIAVLTAIYSKRYHGNMPMSKYKDEFDQLFSQLETMGDEAKVPESHKAPLLLASLGTNSKMENTAAPLRLTKIEDLTWTSVTADLIQEYEAKNASNRGSKVHNQSHKHKHRVSTHLGNKASSHSTKSGEECNFCDAKGHEEENCFANPESKKYKLTPQAKSKLMASKKVTKQSGSYPTVRFGGFAVLSAKVGSKGIRSSSGACLDSGASCTMFCSEDEVVEGSYNPVCGDRIQMAAGSDTANCTGKGFFSHHSLEIPNSVQVDALNGTLVSVSQICDLGNMVVFTENEAITYSFVLGKHQD